KIVTVTNLEEGDRSDRRGEVRVWDVASGQPLGPPIRPFVEIAQAAGGPSETSERLSPPLGVNNVVQDASIHPDGRRVAVAWATNAPLWDATPGDPAPAAMPHRTGAVSSVEFSRDGRLVLTTCHDQTARIWDTETGKPVTPPLAQGPGPPQARFSPDG